MKNRKEIMTEIHNQNVKIGDLEYHINKIITEDSQPFIIGDNDDIIRLGEPFGFGAGYRRARLEKYIKIFNKVFWESDEGKKCMESNIERKNKLSIAVDREKVVLKKLMSKAIENL